MSSVTIRTDPGALGPPAPERARIIRTALLIRAVEERLLELFAEGTLSGTVHTCIGQEFSAAVIGDHLREGDAVFSNHRCHGHYLAATGDVLGLIAEVMGRSAGTCGGRGGSQHLCREGFLSTGILGGCLPIAAGTALAGKLRGDDRIAVAFIGDGTLGEGVLYEVLNIAALWRLPILFVLEDNGYAQSTQQPEVLAGDIVARASAFGVETASANTWQWEHLWHTAGQAVEHVRAGAPFFLKVSTYRLRAHSKGDDDRSEEEVARFEEHDPLNRIVASDEPGVAGMVADVRRVVDSATADARRSPNPLPHPEIDDDPPLRLRAVRLDGPRFVDSLHEALAAGMRANPDTILLGEDIKAPYGGAFKVTRGLSDDHPDKVLNTPISEAAITGIGTGLAMCGMRSFVEIMFGDFMTLATDQLVNQASKIAFLRGPGADPVDVVVRTPMGGRRGYGPTHSQTLDRLFVGTPGLRVVASNSLVDPGSLIAALCRGGHGPTVFLENKLLYGRRLGETVPHGFTLELSEEDFPVARVSAGGRADVTLVGYGGMADYLLAAADLLFTEHDVLAQVLCPTQIYPLRWRRLLDVLTAGRGVVVAEEGPGFAGFGSELLAQLVEEAGALPARRVVPKETPIPAAKELERDVFPEPGDIVLAALEVVGES
ncbi:dehydrogenase E1 component subunit alpha/beta [Lentzea kentuckyensis]|uniref:dehydrogenase E1 component subunit alpha/beta n=1 Tax=Lentzea kentuckyensis TaxID=360086 RepID=UPI000A39399D|nr:alpha-ketoacid dehydrogenase subunit alpha/beta [Lentzea kentuckyensis]